MTIRLMSILMVVTVCTAAPLAWAHTGATGVVKERMDGMKAMTKAIKTLVPMVQHDVPYDAQAVRDVAGIIETHAGQTMLDLFPDGSLDMPTEARPEIWTDWEGFSYQAQRLSVLARGLALSAETGLTSDTHAPGDPIPVESTAQEIGAYAVPTVLNAIGQQCLACHTDYRIKSK